MNRLRTWRHIAYLLGIEPTGTTCMRELCASDYDGEGTLDAIAARVRIAREGTESQPRAASPLSLLEVVSWNPNSLQSLDSLVSHHKLAKLKEMLLRGPVVIQEHK